MPAFKVKHKADPHFVQNGIPKYHDDEALETVVSYCMNPEKTATVGGFGVNIHQAALEMDCVARAFGNEEGLRLRHWILSFRREELYRYRSQIEYILHTIAWSAAGYYAQQYQIIYAIHMNTKCPHIHFVMSTTNYVTGKKYPGDKADYYAYQEFLQNILQPYGMKLRTFPDD